MANSLRRLDHRNINLQSEHDSATSPSPSSKPRESTGSRASRTRVAGRTDDNAVTSGSEKDDSVKTRRQRLGSSKSSATPTTASTTVSLRSRLKELKNEQTVKKKTGSDSKRRQPLDSTSSTSDKALADSLRNITIESEATVNTAVDKESTKPADYVPHIKFKARFHRFKDFTKEAAALTKTQSDRWIRLFKGDHNASAKPSLLNSRMADSSTSTPRQYRPVESLHNILSVLLLGSTMMLEIDLTIGKKVKTDHTLILDTGSVVTWVPADAYLGPRSKKDILKTVDQNDVDPISYPVMNIALSHSLYKDDFEIGGLYVHDQEFAVVREVPEELPKEFKKGVFAIGPESQSAGFMKSDPSRTIPTVMDNMVKQRKIDAYVVVLNFHAWDDTDRTLPQVKGIRMTGEITFGGINETVGRGMKYVPATKSWPARNYYGVDLTVTFASAPTSLDQTSPPKALMKNRPGIIDSGTPTIVLAPDVFKAYVKEVGARLYKDDRWYINKRDFNKLKILRFHFLNGSEPVEFDLNPYAQVMPPNFTKNIDEDKLFLLICKVPVDEDDPINQTIPAVILGNVFLQRCIVVYNASMKGTKEVMIGIKKNYAADHKWQGLP